MRRALVTPFLSSTFFDEGLNAATILLKLTKRFAAFCKEECASEEKAISAEQNGFLSRVLEPFYLPVQSGIFISESSSIKGETKSSLFFIYSQVPRRK